MPRPRAKELTERELEIMHVFWQHGERTAQAVRDHLAADGRDLAYTTVATLIRILSEKNFIEQTNDQRPFIYRPIRSFEDVSGSLLSDLVERVFGGSREQLLLQLMESRELSQEERAILQRIADSQP
jgi:BlaI family transcriptional regulator, penicillinase repressor